jgi:hypothetical protein
MSRSEADLVAAIRHELAALTPERSCCRQVELDALADSGRREDIAIARTIHRLTSLIDAEPRRGQSTTAVLGQSVMARSAAALARAAGQAGASHCRRAALRGRILARGSLSLASGRAHLELVVRPLEGDAVNQILARESLGGTRRLRRGRAVFVWKGEESVLHLLRVLGGGASLAALEARSVGREVRGAINRAVNAETANLRRTVGAGLRQASAVRLLANAGAIDTNTPRGLIAQARLDDPSATLSDIARALNLSRGVVQRGLAALERDAAALATASARRALS